MAGDAGALGRAFVEIHVPVEQFVSQMGVVGTSFASTTSRMIAEGQMASAAIASASSGIIVSYNAVATAAMGLLTAQELAVLSTNNLSLAFHYSDVAARAAGAGGVVLGTGMAAGAAGVTAVGLSLKSLMVMAKSALPLMAAFMAVSKTIGIAGGAVDAQREFNKELFQLWTLTDLDAQGIDSLGKEIRDLTHDYNVFAKAGTKAMYQVYSATFYGADATEILEVGMKSAAAGVTDVMAAVDMTTTVLNAYGMAASEATRVNDLLFTAVRYGKCVTGDTRVLLADGRYKRIDELEEGAKVVSYDGKSFLPMDATWVDQGVKPTVQLRTYLGREISTTWNHPYLTESGWKKVSELSVGDKIAVPANLPFFGTKHVAKEEAGFLGLWIAEGYAERNGSPRIGSRDYGEHIERWAEHFGCVTTVNLVGDNETPVYRIVRSHSDEGRRKNPCKEFLKRYSVALGNAADKHIPEEVFSWDKESMAELLHWLFNGDGSLSHHGEDGIRHQLKLTSKSEELIRQVSHLLLRFGIVGHVRKQKYCKTVLARLKKPNNGVIWIWQCDTNFHIRRFIEQIGIDRQCADEVLSVVDRRNPVRNGDTLTYERAELVREMYATGEYSQRYVAKHFGVSQQQVSRIIRKERWADEGFYPSSSDVQNEIIYVSIEEITERGEEHVYDLCVPELHNFVANDIVAHNTTYEELSAQFGRLAGVAAPAGARLEEMTAAIATLTRQGIMTDWAVTSLRQTIMSMFRPTGALANVIKELGYETGRALIQENGFVGGLKMIKEQADATGVPLENLFTNVRAITAVLPLLTTASEGFAKDMDRMADSIGTQEVAFQKVAQSWDYRLDVLKSQLNDVSITIGEMLLPAVEAFMTVWTGFAEVMEKVVDVMGPFGQGLGALAGWVSGAAVSVGTLTAAIWLLNKAFIALAANPVVAALATVALAIGVIVSQIMDANSAVHTLADEIRGLPTPGTVEAGRVGMPTASADIVAKFTPEINAFLGKWTEIMARYTGVGAAAQVQSWLPNLIRELEYEAMPSYTGGFSRESQFAITIDNAPVRQAIIATLISGIEDPSVAKAIADRFGMAAALGLSGELFPMDLSGLFSSVFYDTKVAISVARAEFDALWSSIQKGTVVVEDGETKIEATLGAWSEMGDIAQASADFLKLMMDALDVDPAEAVLLEGIVQEMLAIAGVTDDVMTGFVAETYALIAAFGAAEEGSVAQAELLGELAGRYKTAAGWMDTFKKAGIAADDELVALTAALEAFNFAAAEAAKSFIEETYDLIAAYNAAGEGSEEQAAALTDLTSRYQTSIQWTELLASVGKEADEELSGLIAALEDLGVKLKDTTKTVDSFDVATYKLLATYNTATAGSIEQAEALSSLSGRYQTATGWLEQFAAVGITADAVLLGLIAALEAIGLTGEAATQGFVDETNALIEAFYAASEGSAEQAEMLDDLSSRYSTVTGWIEALASVGIEASEALMLLVEALEEVGLKATEAAEKTFVQATYELIAAYDAASKGSVEQAEALQSLAGRYQTAIALEELLVSKGIEADDELVLLIADLQRFAKAAEEASVDLVQLTGQLVSGIGGLISKFGGEGLKGTGSVISSLGGTITAGAALATGGMSAAISFGLSLLSTIGTGWLEWVTKPAAAAQEEMLAAEEERLAKEQAALDNMLAASDAVVSSFWNLVESAESVARIQEGLAQLQVNIMSALLGFLWPLAGILESINELFVLQEEVMEKEIEAREKMLGNLNVPIGFPINRIRYGAATPGEPVEWAGQGEPEADEEVAALLEWWQEALEPFRNQILLMIQPIAEFRDSMRELATDLIPSMLQILEPILDTFGWTLGEISTWMQEVFKPDFEEFAEGFATFWTDKVDPWWEEDVFPQIGEWLDRIYGWLDAIIDFFSSEGWEFLSEDVWGAIKPFVDTVLDMFQEFGEWVGLHWDDIKDNLLDKLDGVLTNIVGDLDTVLGNIKAWLLGTDIDTDEMSDWEWLMSKISGALGFLRQFVDSAAAAIRFFGNILGTIMNVIISFFNLFIMGLNGVIALLNLIPFVNIPNLPLIPRIPWIEAAIGGIVTGPTPLIAGESGPEAIIPLNQLAGMLSMQPAAAGMTGFGGFGGGGGMGGTSATININLSQDRLAQIMLRQMTSANVNDNGVGFAPIRVG